MRSGVIAQKLGMSRIFTDAGEHGPETVLRLANCQGVERVTTLNLKVVRTDVERGLILVEGAVPGAKSGWVTLRDAVKKQLPKDIPIPGKFRLAEEAAAPAADTAAPAAAAESPAAP